MLRWEALNLCYESKKVYAQVLLNNLLIITLRGSQVHS